MAYDPAIGGALLFGGYDGNSTFSDTWVYSLANQSWVELHPVSSPPPTAFGAMVWDSAMGSIVLFGGMGLAGQPLGGTWAFEGGSWKQVATSVQPSPRWGSNMAYNTVDGTALLFGGNNGTALLSDTWLLSKGNWTAVNTAPSPPARYDFAMSATDGGYPVLFGGFGESGSLNDSWIYQNDTWTNMTPLFAPGEVTPGPAGGAVMFPAVGILGNGFMVEGGTPFTSEYATTWLLYVPFGGNAGGLTVNIVASALNGTAPLSVRFTADVSGGFPPYNYTWNFGDITPFAYGVSVTHVFRPLVTDTFYTKLTIVDSQGDQATYSVTVSVIVPPPPPPPAPPPPWALYIGVCVVVGLAGYSGYVVTSEFVELRRRSKRMSHSLGVSPALSYPAALADHLVDFVRSHNGRILFESVRLETWGWLQRRAHQERGPSTMLRSGLFWLGTSVLSIVAKLLIIVTIVFFLVQATATPFPSVTQLLDSWANTVWGFLSGSWLSATVPISCQKLECPLPLTSLLAATLELMLVSLVLSVIIAYPLGLLSGWVRGGKVDSATRAYSTFALFFPTIALSLLMVGWFYGIWIGAFGTDSSIFHIIPDSAVWYDNHMGSVPQWVNLYGFTSPTGFPIVDAAIHHAWPLEEIVVVKTLFQGAIVALIYSTIYLRYLRLSVAEASEENHLVAARSRGVKERTLLWKHTSRRALPLYVSAFSTTFGAFLFTVVSVELIFSDGGIGIAVMGVLSTNSGVGTLVPVLYVFAIMVVLTNFVADGLLHVLDKRVSTGSVLGKK
jgi:peptide/nickel transport system permease protein